MIRYEKSGKTMNKNGNDFIDEAVPEKIYYYFFA